MNCSINIPPCIVVLHLWHVSITYVFYLKWMLHVLVLLQSNSGVQLCMKMFCGFVNVCMYRMAQNFDGGKFWQIRVGKILMIKKLMNAKVSLIITLTAHTDLLVIRIYSYVASWFLIPVCTCICTRINCNWHKHKSATPFLGSHRSMAKGTWYHIAAHALIGFHACQ